MLRIYKIDSEAPDLKTIDIVVQVLRVGGLIIYPTDTVYGLGADATNPEAVLKIFRTKRRPPTQSLPVAVLSIKMVESIAHITWEARWLMEKFWPGPLTIVLKSKGILPKEVTAGGKSIGVRIPKHEVPLAIMRKSGLPLISTSANIHGMPSPITASEAIKQLGNEVDIALDAGATALHVSSTVIDLTTSPAVISRIGPIDVYSIKAVIGDVLVNQGE